MVCYRCNQSTRDVLDMYVHRAHQFRLNASLLPPPLQIVHLHITARPNRIRYLPTSTSTSSSHIIIASLPFVVVFYYSQSFVFSPSLSHWNPFALDLIWLDGSPCRFLSTVLTPPWEINVSTPSAGKASKIMVPNVHPVAGLWSRLLIPDHRMKIRLEPR